MSNLLSHLYEALSSPLGKVVSSPDPLRLRTEYYKVRQAANDPLLDVLSFTVSPTDETQLWIVKNAPKG